MASRSLKKYIEQAWRVVEPGSNFVDNWHIDAISEHLEACVPVPVFSRKTDKRRKERKLLYWRRPQISRLLINIPPRMSKSLQTAVFFPSWVWGPKNLPYIKFLYSSYAEALSIRDSVKCRRLISSEWYQNNWGNNFSLQDDQNAKVRYDNNFGGYRLATSVGGSNTGEGGDIIVIDDPISVLEATRPTKAKINECIDWYDNVMSTRLNNQNTGVIIIIMQRCAEDDLSGHVISKELGFEHLCLPMEYEKNHPHKSKTSLNFTDPRIEEGELLNPKRMSRESIEELKKTLGPYGQAGQLQQRPVGKGGGLFDVTKFEIKSKQYLEEIRKRIVASIRYWDKAGSEDSGAYTAGCLMHRLNNDQYVIEDQVRGQWLAPKRENRIDLTCKLDGKRTIVYTEQEPGSGGKESAERTQRRLASMGYICRVDKVTGAKEVRAEPYSISVDAGNVILIEGAWNKQFLDEHEFFPNGKYKDQVDSAAGAYNKLAEIKIVGVNIK